MSYVSTTEGDLHILEIQSHGDTIDIRQKGDGPVVITTHDCTAQTTANAVIEGTDLVKLRVWLSERK